MYLAQKNFTQKVALPTAMKSCSKERKFLINECFVVITMHSKAFSKSQSYSVLMRKPILPDFLDYSARNIKSIMISFDYDV
jgi:hypothetical protein